jgi:hypothetical protein
MARRGRFSRFSRTRRKRRIPQGTWFPISGTSFTNEGETFVDAAVTITTNNASADKSAGPDVQVFPITQDYTQFPDGSQSADPDSRPSLRDYTEGQDYLLKRLVGNLVVFANFGANQQGNFAPGDQWTHIQVGAGFFVARAADFDQSLPDLTVDEFDPLAARNIQNSWIWRRTWLLDNPQNAFPINTNDQFTWDISSNRDYGGSAETGPHFDTKSRRRIKREERLWCAIAVSGWDGGRVTVNGQNADQPYADVNLDVRLFGKMMRGKTSSTF